MIRIYQHVTLSNIGLFMQQATRSRAIRAQVTQPHRLLFRAASSFAPPLQSWTATLPPYTPGSRKPRIAVLGCGWAAMQFIRDVDESKYDLVCISPRDHMLFTPLLASTTVGTLEHRSVIEPIRPLAGKKGFTYVQGKGSHVDIKVCSASVGMNILFPMRHSRYLADTIYNKPILPFPLPHLNLMIS